jgi:ABC-type glutathione transport system ATPase component
MIAIMSNRGTRSRIARARAFRTGRAGHERAAPKAIALYTIMAYQRACDPLHARITHRFGAVTAVGQVDLEVRAGELVALLGPSGGGKTTLLRIIAGFLSPTAAACSSTARRWAICRRTGAAWGSYSRAMRSFPILIGASATLERARLAP